MAAKTLYFLNQNAVKTACKIFYIQSYRLEMASRVKTNPFELKLGHMHVYNSKWPPK